MARSGSARRGVLAALTVVVLVVAVVVVARIVYRAATNTLSTECRFGSLTLSTDQSQIASSMTAVVVRRALPERAAVLVLAAALQESKLRNIPSGQGDRDSVGVLQQRPSQGWGSAAQLSDVAFATGAFLDALLKVPNWQTDTLAVVIQKVQISADGSAYAQHETQAQVLANAFVGSTPRGVSCTFAKPTQVAAASEVAVQVAAALPVNAPSVSGRTVRVGGARWATAAWFVANADRLGIGEVDYSGSRWTRTAGWANATATSDAVHATLATSG